jgi:hypothetical protein
MLTHRDQVLVAGAPQAMRVRCDACMHIYVHQPLPCLSHQLAMPGMHWYCSGPIWWTPCIGPNTPAGARSKCRLND